MCPSPCPLPDPCPQLFLSLEAFLLLALWVSWVVCVRSPAVFTQIRGLREQGSRTRPPQGLS